MSHHSVRKGKHEKTYPKLDLAVARLRETVRIRAMESQMGGFLLLVRR